MDKNNKNVKDALDEIFGSDFLEIDLNNNESKETINNDLKDEKEDNETNALKSDNKVNDKKAKKNNWFMILLVALVLFIIVAILLFFLLNKEKVTTCIYSASDSGYKITDKYIITHKKNKITYLKSEYLYKAKTEDFYNQINYVKEEKLPIIINSNGMPGFTYQYEYANDYFKVLGYLDFTLFDYKVIDKNDNEKTPISYLMIDSKTTYDSMVKELKNSGYRCIKK